MELNDKRPKKQKKQRNTVKKSTPTYKIPKECLVNALKLIDDPENEVWKDRSTACEKSIHLNQESTVSYISNQSDILDWELQLRYARECLVRRDWHTLSEILLLYKPQRVNEYLFPIYAKYASICLAYTNQPLLESLLQSLGCKKSTKVVLKKWTQLSKSTNETDANEFDEEC